MIERSIGAKGTDEEAVWYALLERARQLHVSGREKEFVKAALDAFRRRPQRGEPLHDLAHYCFGKSRGDISAIYADAGLSLPIPESDHFGVEETIYQTGFKEIFTIAASYSRDPEEKERGRAILQLAFIKQGRPNGVATWLPKLTSLLGDHTILIIGTLCITLGRGMHLFLVKGYPWPYDDYWVNDPFRYTQFSR